MSLGARTVATAVAVGTVSAVTLVVLTASIQKLHDAGTRTARTQETLRIAGRIDEGASALAAGERGFVATGDTAFLGGYDAALRAQRRDLARLGPRLTAVSSREYASLRAAVRGFVDGWIVPQVTRAYADPATARALEAGGTGIRLHEEVNRHVDALMADEQRVAARQRADAAASARYTVAVGVVGFSLVMLLALIYVVFLRRSVAGPARRLSAAMERVEAGDLATRSTTDGAAEIGDLERGFNKMAAAIADQRARAERSQAALAAERDSAERLSELARRLAGETDIHEAARVVVDRMADAVDADAAVVYARLDEAECRFQLLASRGCDDARFPQTVGPGDDTGMAIRLPLDHGARALGVAAVDVPGPLAEPQRLLLARMAEQSARIFDAILAHRRIVQLGALNERLIESSRDGIRLIDLDGNILAQNTRMAAMIGSATASLSPRSFWEQAAAIAPRTADPRGFAAMTEQLRADPELEVVYEYELPESGRVLSRFVAPVYDADGTQTGRIVALRDVTSERMAQRAKDEFVASVTHELRTPLTSISGYVELLLDDASDELTAEQRHFLGVVERNSERLLGLVNDLLFVGRLESGMLELEPSPTDLAAILADGAEAARLAAEAQDVRIELTVEPLPDIVADGARLGQLVDNLLSNAVKFTPPGGRVSVTAGRDGDTVTVRIADTGIGVPEAEKPRLFDRFFRASTAIEQAVPGTGLGLSITKAIAEAHGGSIAVEDTPGGGTTFRVKLPLVAAPAKVAA